jgi:hypothetical protein
VSASDQLRNLHAALTPGVWTNDPDPHGEFFSRQWFDKETGAPDGPILLRLDDLDPLCLLRNALPLIADAIAAAEDVSRIEATGVLPDFMPLARALAALEDALKESHDRITVLVEEESFRLKDIADRILDRDVPR